MRFGIDVLGKWTDTTFFYHTDDNSAQFEAHVYEYYNQPFVRFQQVLTHYNLPFLTNSLILFEYTVNFHSLGLS